LFVLDVQNISVLGLKNKLAKCYVWSIALYGAGTWRLRAVIRNIWNVLKCGAGEDQLDQSCEKRRSIT
jgi:hypothetical protein